MVVLVALSLAVAAPKVAADIERDREIELQHRGMQYRRAIQLYYRKFQAYPPNMEALVKTSEIRFLRKRYVDPATGKDEWHLIHFGENKTPTAMGFFGQPLAGSTLAGVGPGGVGQNLGTPMNSAFGSNGSTAGGSGFGGSSSGFGSNSGFGSSGGLSGGSSFGSSGNSAFGGNSTTSGTSSTDPGTSTGTTGATGTNTTGGTGTDTSSTSSSSTSSTSTSAFGGGNQTFGGGGIIGVESTSAKATILEYKKKKHFNEWEFVYDPAQERQTLSNNIGIGQPVGGPGNSGSTFTNTPGISNTGTNSTIPPPNGGTDQNQNPPQQPPNQQQ